MAKHASAWVESIYRYPVKGLSREQLDSVALSVGQTIPFDRAWAIQDSRGRFDPAAPKYLPKINFLMLMRDEALAALETRFDEATLELAISLGGREVARGKLSTREGRAAIEQFIGEHMAETVRGQPSIVSAEGHSFSDVSAKCLHIVNRASLDALERAAGRDINVVRFRPNVVVDGWPAWFEFSLTGKQISIGGARFEVFDRTTRCPATNVDPATGTRNMTIPDLLRETIGHPHFGVYAKVVSGGTVSSGDPVNSGY